MKWLCISLIVVLQLACVYSAFLAVKSRRAWMTDVRDKHARGVDYSDLEIPKYPEIGIAANWPMHFAVTTGDPGLPPMVLSLLLLFVFLSVMRKDLEPALSVYAAAFLVALIAFHLGMVLQQNSFLETVYDGKRMTETSDHPGYTSIHGFVYWTPDKKDPSNSVKKEIVTRDPAVIPILLCSAFLAGWLPFATRAKPTNSNGEAV